jgi:hypothetical protein
VTGSNPFQQVTDVLGQASREAPQIAQQLSAIAQPFAHGLPSSPSGSSPAPPPVPTPAPLMSPTAQAILVGLGAVTVVGVAAYFLGRNQRSFASLKLDLWEERALRALADPDFRYSDSDPDAKKWDAAFESLKAKGLMYVKPPSMKLSEWEWRALHTLHDPNFTYDSKDPYAFLWDEAFDGLVARGLMRIVKKGNDLDFEITPEGELLSAAQFVPTSRAKRLLAGVDEDEPVPATDRTPEYEAPPSPRKKKYSLAWLE